MTGDIYSSIDTARAGCILCDGQAFDPAVYPTLSAKLGGTSNVPDLRGKVLIGAGSLVALQASGGADTVTLTTDNLPAHAHSIGANSGAGTSTNPSGNVDAHASASIYSNVANTTAAPTESTGNGVAFSITQSCYGVNFFIEHD